MSFLGWLFGGRRGRVQEQARVLSADEQMRRLLARFGALGMEKQAGLQELVGEASWSGDVAAQSLTFDNGFSCRIQAIGSYSLRNDTWRWAWTNAKAGWPDEALADARAMREYGRSHGLALLLDETDFALERRWVHAIGMTASALCKADAYYLANYGEGILVCTVYSPEVAAKNAAINADISELATISTTLEQLFSNFELNYRRALRCYLKAKGFDLTEDSVAGGSEITARKEGVRVTARFNELGLLQALDGAPAPIPPAAAPEPVPGP
ncbi:DUF6882 domain-containing protein [Ottowia cancrivicina]|uniref:Uncharacterized protein n=1 Tax=Ottowia cancrivicina TaxID=3040346 RepID=A0AAW6RQU2_9BURK|nr:DUF6882 domain-containing protein [Ottowia sp. 10c7w1]MDG9700060.1 hypothetical protein [Ottowia sp. 10c7w1]